MAVKWIVAAFDVDEVRFRGTKDALAVGAIAPSRDLDTQPRDSGFHLETTLVVSRDNQLKRFVMHGKAIVTYEVINLIV